MEEFKSIINKKSSNSSLEESYNEALKDPDFKEFVSKINLPKEKLMKYTSLLKTSKDEYCNCKNCKSIMSCKNNIEGYAYLPTIDNDRLVFNYRECRYREKLREKNAFKKNITLYQTQDGILDANVKDIYLNDGKRLDAYEFLNKFKSSYPKVDKGIYLHGSFGSGKSYLVTAILVELAKKDVKSTIVFWPEFLRELKTYFGDDISLKRIMTNVKETEILFIDDIGAENLTAWARDEILAPILQYRMDNNLKTMFTSNLTLKQLEKHLSITKDGVEEVKARRIIERIKQLSKDIELTGANLRK